jgi:hypothetical protein
VRHAQEVKLHFKSSSALWGVIFSLSKVLCYKPALWNQALQEVPCRRLTGVKPKLAAFAGFGLRPFVTWHQNGPRLQLDEINIASAAGDRCSPNICCLWTFSPFDNFEFDVIPLLKSAITIPDDRGIVNKDVRTIIAPYEAIALGVVEPLYDSAHSRSF